MSTGRRIFQKMRQHLSITYLGIWAVGCVVFLKAGRLAGQDEAIVTLYSDMMGVQSSAWSVEHAEWQYGITVVVPFFSVDLEEDGRAIEGPSASPQALFNYIDTDVVEYFFFDFGNSIDGLYSAYPIDRDYVVQLIGATGNEFEIATSFRVRAPFPLLQTSINAWVSAQLAFDSSSKYLLRWNEFSTGQPGDQILIEAQDISGSRRFEQLLSHSAASVEIPAGTFINGDVVDASITFIYNTNEPLSVSPASVEISATGGDISRTQTTFQMIADSTLVELFADLAINTISVDRETEQVELIWQGKPDLVYSVQKQLNTPYTATGWETVAQDITCPPGEEECRVFLPWQPKEPQAFYQLQATKTTP